VFKGIKGERRERDEVMGRIAYTGWMIWKARCCFVLEHKEVDVFGIIRRIRDAVHEYYSVNNENRIRTEDMENNRRKEVGGWVKPDDGWLKINCDGAYCSKTKKVGIGVAVRDSIGKVVDGFAKKVKGSSALMIEALTVRERVRLIRKTGIDKSIVEMDSELLYSEEVDRNCRIGIS